LHPIAPFYTLRNFEIFIFHFKNLRRITANCAQLHLKKPSPRNHAQSRAVYKNYALLREDINFPGKKNVHLNFKTESNIFDYFNECSLLSIKNFTYLNDGPTTSGRIGNVLVIFTDFRAYFFWAFLLFVVTLGVYFLIQSNFCQNDKN
jgi:hypothetical protein